MEKEEKKSSDGQVTLTQMLKALDKDVAAGLGKKIKKLSKKAVVAAPLDDNKAKLIERKTAYGKVSKDLEQWDPVLKKHQHAKHISFPLDQPNDVLPESSEPVTNLKPINEFERQIQELINTSENVIHDDQEYSKAEEKYLKAIDSEEAKARHLELQKMRVLLSSYAAKMRRQKQIKSKSYRRLMKQDRIKKHIKKVESSKDNFIEEVEKLKKLRAQERATLKHKNTGKWAKHAKFRTKYDEAARQAMIEQMGLSEKLRQRPVAYNTDSSSNSASETDDDDESLVSAGERSDGESSVDDDEIERRLNAIRKEDEEIGRPTNNDISSNQNKSNNNTTSMLVVNSDLISERMTSAPGKKTTSTTKTTTDEAISNIANAIRKAAAVEDADVGDAEDDDDEDDVDEDEAQHRLMSEAFADDDVVSEFKKAKQDLANEEQPKDINLYLPGWNDWTGPGIKINKRKQKRYTIKAEKRPRQDDKMGNVIISEEAVGKANPLEVKKLPHYVKSADKFEKLMRKPIVGTFTSQIEHRAAIKPRIETKMGARIEPMNKQTALKTRVKFV